MKARTRQSKTKDEEKQTESVDKDKDKDESADSLNTRREAEDKYQQVMDKNLCNITTTK